MLVAICKSRSRHKNFITALNIKHASKELLSFKNFIYKEKCEYSKMKECKRSSINKYFFRGNLRSGRFLLDLYLVLAALKCYFGDNGHKMQISFKTLVSKNAATWRLHETSG